jgi:hypothetical protein
LRIAIGESEAQGLFERGELWKAKQSSWSTMTRMFVSS